MSELTLNILALLLIYGAIIAFLSIIIWLAIWLAKRKDKNE